MAYPVVLIHGMWCNASHLARLNTLLSARAYDCRVPTLPAHEPGPQQAAAVGALSIRDYVESVERFIAEQRFAQAPILVGHSMGGLIAQLLAARVNPLALVLLTPASPAGINALVPKVLPVGLPMFSRPGFWKTSYALSEDRARRYAMNGLHVSQQDRLLKTLVQESGRAASEIVFWWADPHHATRVDPATVRCPVYVVSAGEDCLTPSAVVRKVAGRYPQATHRHWPHRGHWVIDDADTEDMVHEIDGWLRPILQRAQRPAVVLPSVKRIHEQAI